MVLGFGQNDALTRNQLGGRRVAALQCGLHGLNQGAAEQLYYSTTGTVLLGIKRQFLEHFHQNALVLFSLIEIFFPFFLQFRILNAFERDLINLNPAALVLEGLQQQFFHLELVHVLPLNANVENVKLWAEDGGGAAHYRGLCV